MCNQTSCVQSIYVTIFYHSSCKSEDFITRLAEYFYNHLDSDVIIVLRRWFVLLILTGFFSCSCRLEEIVTVNTTVMICWEACVL